MEQAQGIAVIIFAGGQELLIRLDHEVAPRAGTDPLTVAFDQVFDDPPNLAFMDLALWSGGFAYSTGSIDLLYESLSRTSEFPALMGFKESQNLSFEIV
jgi:hypothetical protein